MASSKEYLEFVLEQLAELDEITYRAMMGESSGKSVGLLSWSHYATLLLPVILLCMAMNNYLLPSTNYTCRQKKN